jgi:hypothetical protein
LNATEQAAVRKVIAGIDDALTGLEADVARLQRDLDAGIQLDTIGWYNAAILKAKRV